jgi:hypothetical protein
LTRSRSSRLTHYLRSPGAAEAIDYYGDWVADARTIAPRGVGAVFDCVGGETFRRRFETVRDGGRVVTIVAFSEEIEPGREGRAERTRAPAVRPVRDERTAEEYLPVAPQPVCGALVRSDTRWLGSAPWTGHMADGNGGRREERSPTGRVATLRGEGL